MISLSRLVLDTKHLRRLLDPHRMLRFWFRRYRIFFLLLMLVVVAVGGCQWYGWIYRYEWTDDQKKNYLQAHIKETRFREEAFDEALEYHRKRQENHARLPGIQRDLFR